MEFVLKLLRAKAKNKFRKDLKIRKMMFEKYQVLMENGMSYKDITKRLLKRMGENNSAESQFLQHVRDVIDEGGKFSEALKGWSTPNEILIISSGEGSGSDIKALEQAVSLMSKLMEMRATIISASIYPSFLMLALFGVIYGFANFMIPILTDFSDPLGWSESAQNLKSFTTWISSNILIVILIGIAFFYLISYSLPNFNGRIRDKILDRIPPYSLYKEIQSGLFLVSLSTLMQSSVSFRKSLVFIEEEAPDYLKDKVSEILINVEEGKNEGESMNTDFIGDIGDDIEDFAAGASIEVAMQKLGDQVVKEKIAKIEKSAGLLKVVAMLLVLGFVLWAYSSFIEITQGLELE